MITKRLEEKQEREEDAKRNKILKTLGATESMNHRTGLLSFETLKEATKKRIESQFSGN
jgi:hypothetical protein